MMDIKQILLSDASTDAKLSALAILIDKQFPKLENKVLEVEKLQGPVGDKGDKGDQGPQGERGKDGKDGKNGSNGKDGVDGKDGENGVSIDGVKIDFDGSLVVTLTDGRVINVGEIVPIDVAEKIRTVHNIQIGSGGDSQTVLDAIAALQATIATYGTMATQNANNVAITGGTINNTTIGATTPSTGVFTTLTATGQTSLGGAAGAEGLRVIPSTTGRYLVARGSSGNPDFGASGGTLILYGGANSGIAFYSNGYTQAQFNVAHTASAVNYVQVTGAATGGTPTISFQGSDSTISGQILTKGAGAFSFYNNGGSNRLLRIDGAVSAVNFLGIVGAVAGNAPILSVATQSSDTNSSLVIQSKGTGAIDLAAGSRGVNISNGGTVTAITRTANGTGYTSIPSVAITAPTTAGGVQATATATMFAITATVQAGGTGYAVGNVLTVVGGTYSSQATFTVSAVSAGVVTAVTLTSGGTAYSVLPTNPVSTTGGTGTGATLNITSWGVSTIPVGTAGSGYVEQPTVTFSGGGGSGAAAYATVGSRAVLKSLGVTGNGSFDFHTPASDTNTVPVLRLRDVSIGTSNTGFVQIQNNNGYSSIIAQGPTNASINLASNGTGSILFNTNSTIETNQMRVTHTASAVNYVQVTGAATTAAPVISVQGSDANVAFGITSKGTSAINLLTNGGNQRQVQINHTASAVNYLTLTGSAASSAPVLAVAGTDTNIDLTLTPKGTGNVRFGTYTGTALSIAGYIEIKDSGGTVRKLAVVA